VAVGKVPVKKKNHERCLGLFVRKGNGSLRREDRFQKKAQKTRTSRVHIKGTIIEDPIVRETISNTGERGIWTQMSGVPGVALIRQSSEEKNTGIKGEIEAFPSIRTQMRKLPQYRAIGKRGNFGKRLVRK